MTAGTKVEGPGPFESSLERDYYALLEFEPRVILWHPQAIEVPAGEQAANGARSYFPDVLVEWRADASTEIGERVLVEVKYREDIKKHWSTLKPKFKACRAYARAEGWKFKILTEVEIRTPRLWNAKFLLPYIRREPILEDQYVVVETLTTLGDTTPEALLAALSDSLWERARLLPSLWALVGIGAVHANLERRLTMTTAIRFGG